MSEKDVKNRASDNAGEDGSPNEKGGNASKRKKSSYVFIGFLLIIIAILAVVIYFLFNRQEADERDVIVTEDNVDQVREQMEKAAEDAYYEASMTNDWTFENGEAESKDAFVENPDSNKRTVYFDVNLNDSGKLVYSSPYIPVGKSLQGITLEENLKKGDYPAVVTYHLVDDNKKEVATVSVSVTLHILN
ncbi:MAG: hypothetical protein HFH59_03350 [Lachnospiraceae bacterium]|jgi:flagellar basal body-associated protein FliL|nr:hypothetical protein [Lachnospiraceae bacterium]